MFKNFVGCSVPVELTTSITPFRPATKIRPVPSFALTTSSGGPSADGMVAKGASLIVIGPGEMAEAETAAKKKPTKENPTTAALIVPSVPHVDPLDVSS